MINSLIYKDVNIILTESKIKMELNAFDQIVARKEITTRDKQYISTYL
jgi:hypothetical protein